MKKLLVLTIVLLALSTTDAGCGIDPNGCSRNGYAGAVDPNGRPAS